MTLALLDRIFLGQVDGAVFNVTMQLMSIGALRARGADLNTAGVCDGTLQITMAASPRRRVSAASSTFRESLESPDWASEEVSEGPAVVEWPNNDAGGHGPRSRGMSLVTAVGRMATVRKKKVCTLSSLPYALT